MNKEETIERFYPLVTEAIRRAETLEDLDAPGASAAYLDVSLLEEKIAEALPPSDPEGALARRGAVRAAITAKEPKRARRLVERFLAEDGIEPELQDELQQFSKRVEATTEAGLAEALYIGSLSRRVQALERSHQRLEKQIKILIRDLRKTLPIQRNH